MQQETIWFDCECIWFLGVLSTIMMSKLQTTYFLDAGTPYISRNKWIVCLKWTLIELITKAYPNMLVEVEALKFKIWSWLSS